MRTACRIGRYAAAAFWGFAPALTAEPLRIAVVPVPAPAPALQEVVEELDR